LSTQAGLVRAAVQKPESAPDPNLTQLGTSSSGRTKVLVNRYLIGSYKAKFIVEYDRAINHAACIPL